MIIFLFGVGLSANDLGSLLFHGNCITCHNETKNISAPSILLVKESYKNVFPKKDDFIKQMSVWVEHPKEQTSIMAQAIEKYELMPELGFDLSTLEEIADFIYDTDFSNTNHAGHSPKHN